MSIRTRLAAVRSSGGPSLSALAVGTTALTFVLMLLGVWTAVGGYGLTCQGRWPVCDGAVAGLFPANFGSFVEWFHRLVAMVTGFAILGTTALAWYRGAHRTVRAAFTLALVLTPLQIVLGALTVDTYERVVLATHFGSALAILTLFAVGTALLTDRWPGTPQLAAAGVGATALAAVLAPDVLVVHPVWLHVTYVALALAGFLALLFAAVTPSPAGMRPRVAAALGTVAVAIALVVGRVRLDATGKLVVVAGLVAGAAFGVGALWLARRGGRDTDPAGRTAA